MSVKTMNNVVPDSLYVIPAEDPEKARLTTQYAMKKAIFGYTSAVPSIIDLSRVREVLDVAAGTCIWSADLATIPEVKARLNVRAPAENSICLSACDIETRFFPEQSFLDARGIRTFEHDVTKPFPPSLHGKFDLIHVSFLLLCLTKQGWEASLRNLKQALSIEGILIIEDSDPVVHTESFPPPPEGAATHDIPAALNAPGWVGKANRIYTSHSISNGFIPDLIFKLPSMLSTAGLTLIESRRGYAPAGRLCRGHPFGSYSRELSTFEQFSMNNISFIFQHLAASLLAKGQLLVRDGVKVEIEEEMHAMLKDIVAGMQDDGAVCIGGYFVSKKEAD